MNRVAWPLLAALALAGMALAEPDATRDPIRIEPTSPDPKEIVQRVPGREERIDLVFPAEEKWVEQQRETNPETRVELIELRRTPDELDRWADHAEVVVFHSGWNTSISRVQDAFLAALKADCPATSAKDWLREDLDAPRRITVYTCPEAGPSGTRAVVQLMLQGSDNFYGVNIYLSGETPSEGILVKWVEFLKTIRPCVFGGRLVPCPEGLWSPGMTEPR